MLQHPKCWDDRHRTTFTDVTLKAKNSHGPLLRSLAFSEMTEQPTGHFWKICGVVFVTLQTRRLGTSHPHLDEKPSRLV